MIFNHYWYSRLKIKFEKQGFLGVVLSILKYLNSTLNPKINGEFPFKHLFLKKRRFIKSFCKKNLDILDDNNIITVGNYLVNKKNLNSNSIIYSFGIGENINFEKNISEKFNCKVFAYDPTSLAKNYMSKIKYDNSTIIFKSYGIWKKDGEIKFFFQDESKTSNSGGSITNLFETSSYEELQCFTLSTLMQQNRHDTIDLLKLDIEGAAMDVIDNILQDKIFPSQIVVEFEYSESDDIDEDHFKIWSQRLKNIINNFKEKKYRCYNLPRFSHMPYSTIEILFIRQ